MLIAQQVSALDIAEAGSRIAGRHSESDQPALLRRLLRHVQRAMELPNVLNDMIGRQNRHDLIREEASNVPARQSDAGSRVAGHRFDHDLFVFELGQLPADLSDVSVARHHEHV